MAKQETIKCVKRYHNNLHKMMQLSYCEIYLLHYLTEIADLTDSTVFTNKGARGKFIEFVNKVSKGTLTYSDNSVKQALQTLKRLEFLIPTDETSMMWVNPKYFFNRKHYERKGMIDKINKKLEQRQMEIIKLNEEITVINKKEFYDKQMEEAGETEWNDKVKTIPDNVIGEDADNYYVEEPTLEANSSQL